MRLLPKRGAKLGQHFLTSSDIARTVAVEAGAKEGVVILEVGPGKGMLTKELLALGAHVVAIEKDSTLVPILEETFHKELNSKQLQLIENDARNLHEFVPEERYAVAANIPYYITGELIRLFLTAEHQPHTISILIQKEVAERIARSKKESLLSLSVKAYGNPVYVKTVKAGSFNPPPKVDSAILKIEHVSRDNFKNVSEDMFFDILHLGFGQKRKTLFGNLKKKFEKEKLVTIFNGLNIDQKVRAEDVDLKTWLSLANKLEAV